MMINIKKITALFAGVMIAAVNISGTVSTFGEELENEAGADIISINVLNASYDENNQMGQVDLEFSVKNDDHGIKSADYRINADGSEEIYSYDLENRGDTSDCNARQNDWTILESDGDIVYSMSKTVNVSAYEGMSVSLEVTANNGEKFTEEKSIMFSYDDGDQTGEYIGTAEETEYVEENASEVNETQPEESTDEMTNSEQQSTVEAAEAESEEEPAVEAAEAESEEESAAGAAEAESEEESTIETAETENENGERVIAEEPETEAGEELKEEETEKAEYVEENASEVNETQPEENTDEMTNGEQQSAEAESEEESIAEAEEAENENGEGIIAEELETESVVEEKLTAESAEEEEPEAVNEELSAEPEPEKPEETGEWPKDDVAEPEYRSAEKETRTENEKPETEIYEETETKTIYVQQPSYPSSYGYSGSSYNTETISFKTDSSSSGYSQTKTGTSGQTATDIFEMLNDDDTEKAETDTNDPDEENKDKADEAEEADENKNENKDTDSEINEKGSEYDLSSIEDINGQYLTEPEELVIFETNSVKLDEDSIRVTVERNGETFELEKDTDYTVKLVGNSANRKKYKYIIKKSVFDVEGTYNVYLYSEDKEGNANYSEAKDAAVSFSIDSTEPIILSCPEENESENTMSLIVRDNMDLSEISIFAGDTQLDYVADGDTIKINLPEGKDISELKVVASDNAGNQTERMMPVEVSAGAAQLRSTGGFNLLYVAAGSAIMAAGITFILKKKKSGYSKTVRLNK